MSTATLAGHHCTSISVSIPAWGNWFCDCSTDDECVLAGKVEVVIADMVLQGSVVSGGPYKGSSKYRICGGAAGWGKTIPAKSYKNDLGVKASTILQDAAQECGETLGPPPAGRVGSFWARTEGPAGRALQLLFPEKWYVDIDGLTKFGRRPVTQLTATATRQHEDLDRGVVELAADSIAAIVPGVVVDGIEAVDVRHTSITGKGLRTTIWGRGQASTSRRLSALAKIVEQLLPDLKYRGVYEFRVILQLGNTVMLQPARASSGMPYLQRVPVRPGVAGIKTTLWPGSMVLVTFVDADPSRPCVVGFDDPDSITFMPIKIEIGDTFTKLAARQGDVISGAGIVPTTARVWIGT